MEFEQVATFKVFPHIGEKVLGYLTKETDFKNVFEVCKSWNEILNDPFFWLKKLKQLNLRDEDMQLWMNLASDFKDFSYAYTKTTVNLRKEYFHIRNPFFWRNKLKELNLPDEHIQKWMKSALEFKDLSLNSLELAKSLQEKYFLINNNGGINGKYVCNDCKKYCPTQTVLRCHWKIHRSERIFRCDTCSVSFQTSRRLLSHKRVSGHI